MPYVLANLDGVGPITHRLSCIQPGKALCPFTPAETIPENHGFLRPFGIDDIA
jgi:hypothetical protein